ncbi:hypothetical protein PEC301899_39370 [Pectobacterium carotovorum subsp. carotovorum]|nr:hypothetical protein PEC301899_39370 [Pectobacterium carotovorum subsp. carotovorum]
MICKHLLLNDRMFAYFFLASVECLCNIDCYKNSVILGGIKVLSKIELTSGILSTMGTEKRNQPFIDNEHEINQSTESKSSTKVSLSSQAQQQATLPDSVVNKYQELRSRVDQNEVDSYIRDLYATPRHSGELVSIEHYPDVFNSYTGEQVTPESAAKFSEWDQAVLAETTRIYNNERAKGSLSSDIYLKIQTHISQQPEHFLRKINWPNQEM